MTISPFQNLILNTLDMALREGGYTETELYFEQSTPLVILSQQAEEQDKSVSQVEDETNESLENPATTEESGDQTVEEPLPNKAEEETFRMPTSLSKEYEIYK
jgi:Mn-containing catalase